ncbi:MAG: hypothetical protein U9O66_02705 [Patescibacteria group bacterium]|nr:hypothetical protein [Patescibacteria group bacterium]
MPEFKKFFTELFAQISQIIIVLFFIGAVFFYLFFPEKFMAIIKTLGLIAPIGAIIAVYALIITRKIKKIKADAEEGGMTYNDNSIEIYVTKMDEIKNDLTALVAAILIIALAKFMNGYFDYSDICQTFIVIIAVYITKKIYLKENFSFWKK